MIIALLTVGIHLPLSQSLKDKRSEVSSLKKKLQNKFNISIMESNNQDILQTITLSIASLAATTSLANSILDHVIAFIQTNTQGEITTLHRELF